MAAREGAPLPPFPVETAHFPAGAFDAGDTFSVFVLCSNIAIRALFRWFIPGIANIAAQGAF